MLPSGHSNDPSNDDGVRRRRVRRGLLVVVVVGLLAVGHWLYWYQPRLRAAAPGDDEAGRLFADGSFEHAAWIAHPHQTLPALGALTGLDGPAVEALGRLAGMDLEGTEGVHRLPARAVAVAASSERRWAGAAHVHPLAAGFLRLSGGLAGNPLLAGGRLDLGEAGAATVGWHRTQWSIRSDRADALVPSQMPAATDRSSLGPALAWIRLGAGLDPRLPAGVFALRFTRGDTEDDRTRLELIGGADAEPDPLAAASAGELRRRAGALLAMRSAARDRRPEEIYFLFAHPAGTPASELPRSALLFAPATGAKRSDLPGESLLDLAGHELPRARRGGWQAVATDEEALEGALSVAETLSGGAGADGSVGGSSRWSLSVDLVPASREVRRLAEGLEDSPLLPLRSRHRWRDAAVVLDALAARPGRLEAVVTDAVADAGADAVADAVADAGRVYVLLERQATAR